MTCFIGFGSLVNCATHTYEPVAPVQVPGWTRVWINNDTYDHAFLSVMPDPDDSILGLLARVPDSDWTQLDTREAGYRRHPLPAGEWQSDDGNTVEQADAEDVQMYVHASGQFATPAKPILCSYLVTVLAGFYEVFGARGLDNFLHSTKAWTDIKDDRRMPLYPRYVAPRGNAELAVHEALQLLK